MAQERWRTERFGTRFTCEICADADHEIADELRNIADELTQGFSGSVGGGNCISVAWTKEIKDEHEANRDAAAAETSTVNS